MSTVVWATLAFQVLITILLAISGYYGRKYAKQIDRNTRFRRLLSGDKHFESDGQFNELKANHEDFDQDIQQLKESLEHVKEQCDAMIEILETHLDESVQKPDAEFKVGND